jgi:uncharacterized protein
VVSDANHSAPASLAEATVSGRARTVVVATGGSSTSVIRPPSWTMPERSTAPLGPPTRGIMCAMVARLTAGLVLALSAVACSHGAPPPAFSTAEVSISTQDGASVRLDVQVADDDAERELGLMDRTTVAPYDGMAFVWQRPVETSFWMKDTLIPLTVAFWDETGRIVSILDMPPCRADPCPTYDPGTPVLGALEVPQGDLERRGVALGDTVDLVRSP